jgi:hypothetical protein
MKPAIIAVLLLLFLVITASSATCPDREKRQGPVQLTGLEDTPISANNQVPRSSRFTLDEGTPGSTYYIVGTTWYDNQQNGTAGKQLAVDALGYVHHVWMKGMESGSANRHIFYSVWDPTTEAFMPDVTEIQVDNVSRAGYATVAVNGDGFAFPTFHQALTADGPAHAGSAFDFLPRTGAFQTVLIPLLANEQQVIWPKVDIDINGDLHVLCTENLGDELEYYAKGVPQIDINGFGTGIDWGAGFSLWEPTEFITLDVATSWQSERVAVVWNHDPTDTGGYYDGYNTFLRISEDAGENWGEVIPVTGIPPIDTMCVLLGGDPITCNADTMRPWLDCAVMFDNNDNVHVAWTAAGNFRWDDSSGLVWDTPGRVFSNIWHWDEVRREYNIINEAWYSHTSVSLGVNNLMTHRPNLAIDTTTGYLYCSFVQFDSVQVSQGGYPSGDAYVTVSTDRGQTWAVATNVSGTIGSMDGIGTPPGECKSERDVMLAKFVTNGIIHMQYQLDLDNGTSIFPDSPEGIATENSIIYQRIPVEDIPTSPIINPLRAFRADGTGFPVIAAADNRPEAAPYEFALYQNYPNPFNPATRIQFDLLNETTPTLIVYDVTGREVANLLDGNRLSAGTHVVEFDAGNLPSGVYFYRLQTSLLSQTRKMILIK